MLKVNCDYRKRKADDLGLPIKVRTELIVLTIISGKN